ncbi:YccF domain-containing protein [Halosquirtibacter laminarini]|uniref:YccF domain-containing protein n=1 Tax=Halosquirtibacter laminarini TaxID=3374600 RepID=A0AC61NR39_9BACT|nr:YccF domain-containing protein [Prolixibacteraceae bacterium]
MKIIGNLIWLIFGGFITAIEYLLAGIFYCITIIGIPWGLQCFKYAAVVLWPFGTELSYKPNDGCLNLLLNIVWILLGGWSICLTHIFFGILLSITIIGIPWGRQHFKLARLAILPFSYDIN